MNPENIRVLIADDVPQVRQGLTTMLQLATKNANSKIEVVGEAQNGKEAIEKAQLFHPDAIVMDLDMPVLDGFSATRTIKSLDPSIFIIVLTIYDDPANRQKAAQAGADLFIEKSAPLEGLLRAIQGFRTSLESRSSYGRTNPD